MHLFFALLVGPGLAAASSILFQGGTIIAFDDQTESLQVIRGGSVLVTDDRIASVSGPEDRISVGNDTEVVGITGKILAPGQINTHLHTWQTVFKTLGSNTSLVDYFGRYGEFAAAGLLSADDVYISQLAGVLESVNGGVTKILDHAHHTWSNETSEAGLQASVDSGVRVYWGYTFHNITATTPAFLVQDQIANFEDLASNPAFKGSPTEICIAYDGFGPTPNVAEVQAIMGLAEEFNIPVIQTHSVEGPWPLQNTPEALERLNLLNSSIPFVLSHGSFLSARGHQLLRTHNHYISITPESEFHYGHTQPTAHLASDQATLGVDTHFTFSADMLSQTRLWLQTVRATLYKAVLDRWQIHMHSPMSVNQAFLMSTRHGGLALRRNDLGIIAPGAKADLAVTVDGKWLKKGGKLLAEGYYEGRIQNRLIQTSPVLYEVGESWINGLSVGEVLTVDSKRGEGNGYGGLFLAVNGTQ
ncbi:amidohydrolase-like protein [Cercophora newfieldiana]|uniref:Amidohydrolase-like protein n=1 Tax=Cercophora newfieldiana TaxID=92897 RepID=A0AA40CJ86_9PEZI|nr:amidohydrolase-like protein [Cercophora newfieldiana]